MKQLWNERPELRALYEHNLNGEDLLDMRPLLAQARTLLQFLLSRIDPLRSDGKDGTPLGFKAIHALGHVMRTAEQFLRLETQLGPVTRAEMEQVMRGVSEVIRRFVPADQQGAARAFLREHVGGAHRDVGGEG